MWEAPTAMIAAVKYFLAGQQVQRALGLAVNLGAGFITLLSLVTIGLIVSALHIDHLEDQLSGRESFQGSSPCGILSVRRPCYATLKTAAEPSSNIF
jgi:hypothetical protein